MSYMIEITEKKYEKLSDHIEESLRHLGKAMSCISEIGEPYGFGYRDEYEDSEHKDKQHYSRSMMGSRGRYGYMGYKDDEWDEDEYGERRGRRRRDSRGRYM